jgi:PKD repeat protein
LSSGNLPPGVTLNTATGLLSGTPTTAGSYTPSFTATNSGGTSPAVAVALTINLPVPVIAASQMASGTVEAAFSYQIAASNTPASYALSSGTLPPGVTLTTATGLLSGTPTTAGSYTPSFTATNSGGTSPAVAVTLTITAAPTGVETFRSANGLAVDGSQDLLTPAADDVANLLKFAFNMIGGGAEQRNTLESPNTSILTPTGIAGLPFGGMDGTGKLQITFIRRETASNPGVIYQVEFSDTLENWAVNPSATESTTSINTTIERVTVTDSSASSTKRFVRIKVSSN